MGSSYSNLIETVINASVSDNWTEAVQEWEIIDCEEDSDSLTRKTNIQLQIVKIEK